MNIHRTLICCFVLPALLDAQTLYFSVEPEGGHAEIQCPTSAAYRRKFFCREDCKRNDTLVETEDVSAQSGRYSIEWERRGQSSVGDVSVNISQLKKSDSGRYRCGVGASKSVTYKYAEIIVVDARLDGDEEETPTVSAKSGGDIRVTCFFSSSFNLFGGSAFLCRGRNCWTIPIKETDYTGQHDRYIIRYVQFSSGSGFVYVSVSQLTKLDSGRYSCGLERVGLFDIKHVFDVDVTDEPEVETQTSAPVNSKPETTASKHAASPENTEPTVTSTKPDTLLYVGLTLVALLVLFLLVLLIFCKRKSSKPKDPPAELEYASISEINEAKYTKPKGTKVTGDHSAIAGPDTQHTAEDDSSTITYSELNFSDRTASSLHSAPRGHLDAVIYTTLR